MVPMAGSGGGLMRKVIGVVVVLGVLALVVQHPADAASAAKGFLAFAETVVNGFAAFFREFTR